MKQKKITAILSLAFRRAFAFGLAMMMLSSEAGAVIRQVSVYGAKSINDLGDSDHTVTMDDLKRDYSGYVQTDGLTEYFHKDKVLASRTDMTEALGWLIDHNIINRDQIIRVSNIRDLPDPAIPQVSITKMEAEDILLSPVNLSDVLMYTYKAAFGPLLGRTIGVETQNVRYDGSYSRNSTTSGSANPSVHSVAKTLWTMMEDHNYFTETIPADSEGGLVQEVTGTATGGGQGIEYWFPHKDFGGSGGGGGTGKQSLSVRLNTNTLWRYTPQGDEYTSIFGDTNIFISDVDIEQSATANSGDVNGSHGSGGTGGGGTAQAGIVYETDYKQIYYVPGADILFYDTTDVLEMYLQAIEAKGLLGDDFPETSENYKKLSDQFFGTGKPTPSWSGNADPYVSNVKFSQHWRVENIAFPEGVGIQGILGKNYDVNFSNGTLTITRKNLFNSDSGYFASERVTRMDAYTYIYHMIAASEKRMSTLEADIVNYKYGMELSGLANQHDIDIIKNLIAKGILNFDGSDELSGLYTPITWRDFLSVLYRAANPLARYDFSKVQLTDSETAWKARGFQAMTLTVVDNSEAGSSAIIYESPEISDEGGDETGGGSDTGTEPRRLESRQVEYSSSPVDAAIKALDSLFVTHASAAEDDGGDGGFGAVASLEQTLNIGTGAFGTYNTMLNGYSLNRFGCSESTTIVTNLDKTLDYITAENLLKSYNYFVADMSSGFDESNPLHVLNKYFAQNLWCIWELETGSVSTVNWGSIKSKFTSVLGDLVAKRDELTPRSADWSRIVEAIMAVTAAKNTLENGLSDVSVTLSNLLYNKDISVGEMSFDNVDRMTVVYTGKDNVKRTWVGSLFTDGQLKTDLFPTGNTFAQNAAAFSTLKFKFTCDVSGDGLKQSQASDIMQSTFCSTAVEQKSQEGDGLALQTSGDGRDAYVSWASLHEQEDKLGITRGGAKGDTNLGLEWILYCGKTRAVFTNGESSSGTQGTAVDSSGKMSKAIVGTSIVTSNSDMGVAYKDSDGMVWYHLDAIRMLVNASQDAILSNIPSIGADLMNNQSASFSSAVKSFDVVSDNGMVEGSMSAIWAFLGSDDPTGKSTSSLVNAPLFINSTKYQNQHWAGFAMVAQASRVKNMISKKLTYKSADGSTAVAYALLEFTPVNTKDMETQEITGKNSLQDLLDAPAQEPTDATSKAVFTANKELCNAWCNWMYDSNGGSYIATGYLVPHVTIYTTDANASVPDTVFNSLKSRPDYGSLKDSVTRVRLMQLVNGHVMDFSYRLGDNANTDKAAHTTCSYWLSQDCRVLMTGDRLYLNVDAIDSVTFRRKLGAKSYFAMKSTVTRQASFTLGTTFTMPGSDAYTATVVSTSADGTVTCQVGPVRGLPLVKSDGTKYIIKTANFNSNFLINYLKKEDEAVQTAFAGLFRSRNSSFPEVEFAGIADTPVLTPSQTSPGAVYNGNSIAAYRDGKYLGTVRVNSPDSTTMCSTYVTNLSYNIKGLVSGISGADVQTFFLVTFPASSHYLSGGQLTKGTATASQLISDSMFTSLNDLIIDGMISKAVGAIPINEVPDGALLKIGNYYFQATGVTGEGKSFVGYAPVSDNAYKATLADVATRTFASHHIMAGSQMLNVSHFFKSIKLLDSNKEDSDGNQQAFSNALAAVYNQTLKAENNLQFRMLSPTGSVYPIGNSSAPVLRRVAGVVITFQDYLLAYEAQQATTETVQVEATGEGGTTGATETVVQVAARYNIVPSAVSSEGTSAVTGALENVPVFDDSVIEVGIAERTGVYAVTNYQEGSSLDRLKSELVLKFRKAFASDLFTLLRMLATIILVWLMVASWVCYACRLSNLLPILDSIKHPTRGRSEGAGLDLFKLVSLGTISLETEFTLGRFLEYNCILAVLLLVVRMTG